ncbi:MAG: secretin N-terminal domain-containing protein [Thermoguttaceae bacterium]|jgi:hypothetical protein
MMRIICITSLILTCSIFPAWAQTDAPEKQPAPDQRGTGTEPPIGESTRPSNPPASPAKPSESSPTSPAAHTVPPVIPEPVPVISTKEGENGHTRAVCRLGCLTAKDAADTLKNLLKLEAKSTAEPTKDTVVILPDNASNCLLISGPPAAVEEVYRLASEMDRHTATVRLEVRLSDVPEDKPKKTADADIAKDNAVDNESSKKTPEKSEKGAILTRAELTTLDGQEATIHVNRMEPHVTGVMMNNVGSTNAVTMMNVGTILKLKTRVMPEGIVVLELNIQDVRSGPTEEGAVIATLKDGKSIRSPSTDLLSYQSTLRLQDGQPQTISAITRNGKTCLIAVTAHIIHP